MCNCSYARTFFISSYANLFIYEQFNKFIKIQQVEIFLFFYYTGSNSPLGFPKERLTPPQKPPFYAVLWSCSMTSFSETRQNHGLWCSCCIFLFSLSLFFFMTSFFAVFHCVTVSYARNCFICAYWYILVLIAVLSVKIRVRIGYRGCGKSSKKWLLWVTFAPFCLLGSKKSNVKGYSKTALLT